MTTRILKPTRLLGRSMTEEGDQSVEIVICLKSYLAIAIQKNLQNVRNHTYVA